MTVIKALFSNPLFRNAMFLAISAGGIWVLGPFLSIQGFHPLASAENRWILILGLGGLLLFNALFTACFRHRGQIWKPLQQGWQRSRIALRTGWQRLQTPRQQRPTTQPSRRAARQERRRLQKLPWYLVVGTRQSGKTRLLGQSGLGIRQAELIGAPALDYVDRYPEYDWWFTDQAVFIDMTHQAPIQHEPNEQDLTRHQDQWQPFIRLLTRKRAAQPVSGVLFTFSLTDLLLKDNQSRQAEIYGFFLQLRQLYALGKVRLPLYLIFTKCDLVEGFVEFFNDLSKEELSQVWGFTLEPNQSTELNAVIKAFHDKYHRLMTRLEQRLLWKLDGEKNPFKRELIFAFPQQMRLFKKAIENFIAEIFGVMRQPGALQIRGVYFASTLQMGKPYDFIMTVFSKRFKLGGEIGFQESKQQEVYFTQQLFHRVLLSDSRLLGYNDRIRQFKRRSYRFSMVALPSVAVTGVILTALAYQQNQNHLAFFNAQLPIYQQQFHALDPQDPSAAAAAPILDTARRMKNRYRNQSWAAIGALLPNAHTLEKAIDAIYGRSLSALLLPRIAVELNQALQSNPASTDQDYALLKAYLVFSPQNSTDPHNLLDPLNYLWQQRYPEQPILQQHLQEDLRAAIERTIPGLPLDRDTLQAVRQRLAQVRPLDRAYGLLQLKAAAKNVSDIDFMTQLLPDFPKVFYPQSSQHTLAALYTRPGYEEIFLPYHQPIAEQVIRDNTAIGLASNLAFSESEHSLTVALNTAYGERYQAAWQAYLNQFELRPFATYSDAIAALNRLTQPETPLLAIASLLEQNLTVLPKDSMPLSDAMNTLLKYLNEPPINEPDAPLYQHLKALKTALIHIQQAANPPEAAFLFAKSYFSGEAGLEHPLQQLSLTAAQAPQPINRWLQQLAAQSWQLIASDAQTHINRAWQSLVVTNYQQHLQGRYPLVIGAHTQVSLTAFSRFFGPAGTLDTFFNHYLAPFVNTDEPTWSWYRVNGFGLNSSPKGLTALQRAARIQQRFFPDRQSRPTLAFALKPQMLDERVKYLTVSIAGKSLSYSHGPQISQSLTWPISRQVNTIQVSLESFADRQHFQSYDGPWALFQWWQQGGIRATPQGDQYQFDIEIDDYRASFLVLTTATIAQLQLRDLRGFSLPESLYQ